MTINAKNGVEYYLVDVIAQILKYLKNELIENLPQNQGRGRRLEATDFDWVITVPAIWRSRGKQMMREAGYKVQYKCIKSMTGFSVSGAAGSYKNLVFRISAHSLQAAI